MVCWQPESWPLGLLADFAFLTIRTHFITGDQTSSMTFKSILHVWKILLKSTSATAYYILTRIMSTEFHPDGAGELMLFRWAIPLRLRPTCFMWHHQVLLKAKWKSPHGFSKLPTNSYTYNRFFRFLSVFTQLPAMIRSRLSASLSLSYSYLPWISILAQHLPSPNAVGVFE